MQSPPVEYLAEAFAHLGRALDTVNDYAATHNLTSEQRQAGLTASNSIKTAMNAALDLFSAVGEEA